MDDESRIVWSVRAPLVASQVSRQRGPMYIWTTDRSCGQLAIEAEWLEQYVAGLILDALSEESAMGRSDHVQGRDLRLPVDEGSRPAHLAHHGGSIPSSGPA